MIRCDICTRECTIPEGRTGACGRYVVEDGILAEPFPDMYLVACPISAETMPVLHAYPGETFFQISTLGCNLSCEGCISSLIVKEMDEGEDLLQHIPPEKVIDLSVERNCRGVVFLMNDPLASYLTFMNVAKAAKARGLLVGCSTNGLFTKASLKRLMPYLDFVNLGMKGLWDRSYESCGELGGSPVLENMRILHENGVHVEVSCMMRTDNREELIALASFVASVSRYIPFQVMRFIPFENADISLEPHIGKAEDFCAELRQILDFVYLFNSPGTELMNTVCPDCKSTVLQREFYGPMGARLLTPDNTLRHFGSVCGQEDIAGKFTAYLEDKLAVVKNNLVCATLMSDLTVVLAGIIGWVGLVVPHLTRMLTGPDNRVLIPASALTGALYLLAMDEPVGGLDYGNQVRLLSIVRELAREGYTFIQSTHFPDHALWMGGRVLMLNKGRVVAEGMDEKAVTLELLPELYRVPMDVTRTMCGVTVCVPEEMR